MILRCMGQHYTGWEFAVGGLNSARSLMSSTAPPDSDLGPFSSIAICFCALEELNRGLSEPGTMPVLDPSNPPHFTQGNKATFTSARHD